MVIYFVCKVQVDKFLEKKLFKLEKKSIYTDIWKKQTPGDCCYFNY